MSNKFLNNHLIRELDKGSDSIGDPSAPERLLLTCGYQELLRKIIEQAQVFAHEERSLDVLPNHLERAYSLVMNDL